MTQEQFNGLKNITGLNYLENLLELVSWTNTHSTLEF